MNCTVTKCYLLLFTLSLVCERVTPFSALSSSSRSAVQKVMNLQARSVLIPLSMTEVDAMQEAETEAETESTMQIKQELLELATMTNRGFSASKKQKDEVRNLCETLKSMNPTKEPLYPYYAESESLSKMNESSTSTSTSTSLAGKWTLIYTDAPDITTLDNTSPLSPTKLGRIGQECNPPLIKNVIEWLKPDWAEKLPFSTGAVESRVLQKVCTEASASSSDPFRANLKIVGLDLVGLSGNGDVDTNSSATSTGTSSVGENKNKPSLGPFPESPAKFFEDNPVELRGPLKTPFGSFEVLYLDNDLRIIKTYQGYLAVNTRQKSGEEWF